MLARYWVNKGVAQDALSRMLGSGVFLVKRGRVRLPELTLLDTKGVELDVLRPHSAQGAVLGDVTGHEWLDSLCKQSSPAIALGTSEGLDVSQPVNV